MNNSAKKYPSNYFIAPDIPQSKLNNALKTYANEVQAENVALLIDATVFGSAKSGALLANDKLYYNNTGSRIIIDLTEPHQMTVKSDKVICDGKSLNIVNAKSLADFLSAYPNITITIAKESPLKIACGCGVLIILFFALFGSCLETQEDTANVETKSEEQTEGEIWYHADGKPFIHIEETEKYTKEELIEQYRSSYKHYDGALIEGDIEIPENEKSKGYYWYCKGSNSIHNESCYWYRRIKQGQLLDRTEAESVAKKEKAICALCGGVPNAIEYPSMKAWKKTFKKELECLAGVYNFSVREIPQWKHLGACFVLPGAGKLWDENETLQKAIQIYVRFAKKAFNSGLYRSFGLTVMIEAIDGRNKILLRAIEFEMKKEKFDQINWHELEGYPVLDVFSEACYTNFLHQIIKDYIQSEKIFFLE